MLLRELTRLAGGTINVASGDLPAGLSAAELKRRFDLTVLMAEQNFHEASRIADRGYIIVHGEIAFEGRNLQELHDSELVQRHYLGL